ncbi:AAA family ATPase [Clostridium thermarum]|uniref:AAA family ATPase n=1 Tax=Clostridium thermarum TaxID=1716543 RepID=UPI00111E46F9|nr:AAA family ATPase [Clostridium thermarum]
MKPRKLKIKGLNSFVEEQVIDFSQLTEKGLFGIFGPTGSGKSTVLDAMTIALYGSIARDTREFMNTNCDMLSVSYEFEILYSGQRKVYCAERVLNRDKNGSYKSKHVILTEQDKENSRVVIAEGVTDVKENVERILGLTSEDFTRSVVLPQGKFSEFLKLTGKDRRNMLERLFGLERFGKKLGDRIKARRKELNDSLNIVIGRVKTYEEQGISEDNYKELKELYSALESKRENIRQEKERLDKEYELNKNVWELQLELAEYENKYKELSEQESKIESKRVQLADAQNAWKVKPYFDELKSTEFKVREIEEEIQKIRLQLDASTTKLSAKDKEYKYWYEKKEKELPELIQKEADLTRAMEILSKLKLIEVDRQSLLKEYSEKNKVLADTNKKIELFDERLKALIAERQLGEKRLEDLNVDPAYRDDINKLANLQQEHIKLNKSINDLKLRLHTKKSLISSLEIELKEVILQKDEKFKEIAVTEEKMCQIMTTPPPDNSLLFEKKDKIFKLEKLIEELQSFKAKKEEINSELADIDKKLEGLNTEHERLLSESKFISENIISLEKDIAEGQLKHAAYTLAMGLKEDQPCPVCGSKHHPALAIEENDAYSELIKEKETIVKKQKDLEESIRKIEVEITMQKKNRDYVAAYLEPLENQYRGLELELAVREKEGAEKEFASISSSIENWNKNKDTLEKQLTLVKESKVMVEQKEIMLTEKLKAEKTALSEISADIKDNEGKLQPIVDEVNRLKALYKVEDADKLQKEIRDKEKEGREIQLKVKKINEEITAITNHREELVKAKSSLEVDIARILESGKEKRTVIDREYQYIQQLSEGRDVQKYVEEVTTSKSVLIEAEAKARKEYESCSEENRRLNDTLLKETTNVNILRIQAAEQKERLEEQLKTHGFGDVSIIEEKLLSQEVMKAMEEQITSFDNSRNKIKLNIDRIHLKIGDKRLKEEEWKALISHREEINITFEENIKEIAAVAHRIKEMESNLAEYKSLLKNKKELEHIYSNIDDIAKLVEGNKFVEFVALNQLKYICIEASKRLKNITGGRYALEIDGSGNFIMRDDFNGGCRRATGTLSGGETFLTSLCLALALSSQIQLKGSAPLEFFFLDEGFGTLDNDLLDVVMDSLERLHSDRLCVGIISHVEELKARVPVKLLVDPPRHGIRGSKVKVELS